jgi:hypothetical protein
MEKNKNKKNNKKKNKLKITPPPSLKLVTPDLYFLFYCLFCYTVLWWCECEYERIYIADIKWLGLMSGCGFNLCFAVSDLIISSRPHKQLSRQIGFILLTRIKKTVCEKTVNRTNKFRPCSIKCPFYRNDEFPRFSFIFLFDFMDILILFYKLYLLIICLYLEVLNSSQLFCFFQNSTVFSSSFHWQI